MFCPAKMVLVECLAYICWPFILTILFDLSVVLVDSGHSGGEKNLATISSFGSCVSGVQDYTTAYLA